MFGGTLVWVNAVSAWICSISRIGGYCLLRLVVPHNLTLMRQAMDRLIVVQAAQLIFLARK
jgi:hypothetical protein